MTSSATTPPNVEGTINYLGDMGVRPAFYAVDYDRDNIVLNPQPMPIRDMRRAEDGPSLAREGLAMARHKSRLSDFTDMAAVQEAYLPEAAELLKSLTGARHVLMMPHAILRYGERSDRYGKGVNTRPARFVHVDYTPRSAPGLAGPLLEEAGFPNPPRGRYAGFNIWRALSPPPQDVPLALCDAASVSEADLVPGDAVFDAPDAPEFSFEAYLVRHNPNHRWWYASDMGAEDVLVFKAYDTEGEGPQCVPHVAFDDPTCPADVPPRASIEVRGFAFFDDM